MIDSKLVERIDGLSTTPFDGVAYRHVSHGRDPLDTIGSRVHGGRWNPPNSFSVLYLGLDERTVALEFKRHAARQGRTVGDFLPRRLYGYDVALRNVLDLRGENAMTRVDLTLAEVRADDLRACQSIGEAAQHAGREGILAPSAAASGSVLAVFMDSIAAGSSVQPQALGTWASADALP